MSPQNDFQNYRPITGCLKMTILGEIGHFQACRQGSPRVAKGRQWSPRVSKAQGGPQGWVRWVITRPMKERVDSSEHKQHMWWRNDRPHEVNERTIVRTNRPMSASCSEFCQPNFIPPWDERKTEKKEIGKLEGDTGQWLSVNFKEISIWKTLSSTAWYALLSWSCVQSVIIIVFLLTFY